MSDIITELKEVMLRRIEPEGEFSYFLLPYGRNIAGKHAALKILKKERSKEYEKIKSFGKKSEETDEEFDKRLLGLLSTLPFEKINQQEDDTELLSVPDMFRVVRVEGIDLRVQKLEVTKFFRNDFDGIVKIREMHHGGAQPQDDRPSRWFQIYFNDEETAKALLDRGEMKYNDKTLKIQLLIDTIHLSRVRWIFNKIFHNNLRKLLCIPMEQGKEDNYILMYKIGRPTDHELMTFFRNLDSSFENIVSMKTVLQDYEGSYTPLGVLVQFENKHDLQKFTRIKNKLIRGNAVKYNIMSEVLKEHELRSKIVNYMVDDGPTPQELTDRRLIALRTKKKCASDVIDQLKSLYPEALDVKFCNVDSIAIITFATADIAHTAFRSQMDHKDVTPLNVMPLAKYLEMRELLFEQDADKLKSLKEQEEKIKNNPVVVENNVIKLSVPIEMRVNKDKKRKGPPGQAPNQSRYPSKWDNRRNYEQEDAIYPWEY